MTDRERNRFDALKRVNQFKADHAADFPAAGTPADVKATALFTLIETAVDNTHTAIQGRATAFAQFHGGTVNETSRRNVLLLDLTELNRAAAAIAEADDTPGLTFDFRVPWHATDSELPDKARAMIARAASMSARFIELNFPADFATQLEQHVEDFENAGELQDAGLAQQAGFTSAFDDILAPALTALKQLDVLCRQRFRTDAVKLGAWITASHIERLSGGDSAAGGGGPTPGTPPQPPQNMTAILTGSGGAGEANAEPSAGATEYRVKVAPSGTSDTPQVVATSATLPVPFTLTSGSWDVTLTAANAAGESAPSSPPVPLTVP